MFGIYPAFKDGVSARVAELRILDTYDGQLAGTLTVGTQHRLPSIEHRMEALKAGKETGYYYLTPELVDEAELRGFGDTDSKELRKRTDLGCCLKEQHLVATLHVSDADYCHIIELHWFQTGKELGEKPLAVLIQEATGQLSFADIYPYCEHVDWLDMF